MVRRLHSTTKLRRQLRRISLPDFMPEERCSLYPVVEVPTDAAGKKAGTKKIDLTQKLFDEYGTKYAGRKGGYTRIIGKI